MSLDDDLDRQITAVMEQVAETAATLGSDRSLVVRLAQLLAQAQSRSKATRDSLDRTTRRLIDQHVLLREIRRLKYSELPEAMRTRLDALAPANISPFTRRADLWATHNQETGEIVPATDRQAAELYIQAHTMMREFDGEPAAPLEVIPSPWPETEHWRLIATQEAAWTSDINQMLVAAMQQIEALEAKVDQLRAGLDMPAQPIRRGVIYTDVLDGGRYVLLGNATGTGKKTGCTATIYRCARTSALFYRDTADFKQGMAQLKGE